MNCRHCNAALTLPLVDLGSAPPSNAYLRKTDLRQPEKWYPLRVLVCTQCWLAQTEDFTGREALFTDDYAYFSSCSTTWLAHARRYVDDMIRVFSLNDDSRVAEIGANDGYLLQYVKAAGIPCYGIEPTAGTAAAARARGLSIVERFLDRRLALELAETDRRADLVVANNVLAHVPEINDFVSAIAVLLKPDGAATVEFPHLMRLVQGRQFDTVYHEHFYYLLLTAVDRIFAASGLEIFDVQELATHGGSLRVFAQRSDTGKRRRSRRVDDVIGMETAAGAKEESFYRRFQASTDRVKDDFLTFLIESKRRGTSVAAYGAAAKGNTLINYAGVRPDLLPVVFDAAPSKQGKFLPGSRIPILPPEALREHRPDRIVVLPWNIAEEIVRAHRYVSDWGGVFYRAVPSLTPIEEVS